ncbi:MAG: metallophosphoesterase [Candidatus Cloacimonetes bacterium]|nr:metallophosphoesterase [Candidatus Cloacimonadota bacterium]
MIKTFFVSDLHGKLDRYEKLFRKIYTDRPEIVLMGGDLLPSGIILHRKYDDIHTDFINDYLIKEFTKLQTDLQDEYPLVLLIMGNDDPRSEEYKLLAAQEKGLWHYLHMQKHFYKKYLFFGYASIPPSPFLLKDWERYDVSHFLDVGSISPADGYRTFPLSSTEIDHNTIARELGQLFGETDLFNAVLIFHAPPYQTDLDLTAQEGVLVDHVPMDPHVGSIAVKRLLEERQPYLSLHGHIHESARLSGSWKDMVGKTPCFSAAYDGAELALIEFDLDDPFTARRLLL